MVQYHKEISKIEEEARVMTEHVIADTKQVSAHRSTLNNTK